MIEERSQSIYESPRERREVSIPIEGGEVVYFMDVLGGDRIVVVTEMGDLFLFFARLSKWRFVERIGPQGALTFTNYFVCKNMKKMVCQKREGSNQMFEFSGKALRPVGISRRYSHVVYSDCGKYFCLLTLPESSLSKTKAVVYHTGTKRFIRSFASKESLERHSYIYCSCFESHHLVLITLKHLVIINVKTCKLTYHPYKFDYERTRILKVSVSFPASHSKPNDGPSLPSPLRGFSHHGIEVSILKDSLDAGLHLEKVKVSEDYTTCISSHVSLLPKDIDGSPVSLHTPQSDFSFVLGSSDSSGTVIVVNETMHVIDSSGLPWRVKQTRDGIDCTCLVHHGDQYIASVYNRLMYF